MAITPYMVVSDFRARTIMPGADVDFLEANEVGFLQARINARQAWADARLDKRYDVPFTLGDVPEVVLEWITAMVTYDAYMKRGYNPSSAQDGEIEKNYLEAKAEVKEAADSKDGLFDLPLKESAEGASGIARQAPIGYAEASPYTWTDVQAAQICANASGDLGYPFNIG